jgi:hypothetical protein
MLKNNLNNIISEEIRQIINNTIYKSDLDRYYIHEGLLYENPNQAIKFLKEKNLDPTTNPNGKEILDDINNITRGDGYTFLLTKFYINERMPIDDLSKLHDYLKQNKEHINRLPKPVVTYNTYRELRNDLDNMEGMRAYKKLYNELPANFKQEFNNELTDVEKQHFGKLAIEFYKTLNPKQQEFFLKKLKGYDSIVTIIEHLINYIRAIENNEDYNSIKQKIESTPNTYIAYDNPEQGIIIAHVNSFEASEVLGCTTSWCISREPSRWREYKQGGNKYFFIWDFNYPVENTKYLIGTAFNKKNPEKSQTHLKDDKQTNLEDVVSDKGLNFDIFNNYVDEFNANNINQYKNNSGLIDALKNYNIDDDNNRLIEIVENSEIIQELEGEVSGDKNFIQLGLNEDKMKEMLGLEDDYEYDDVVNYAYHDYNHDTDSDDLNYIHNYLSDDNIKLLIELAIKMGAPESLYNNFKEESGAINEFLEEYDLGDISSTFLYELSNAKHDAESQAAKDLLNKIPFDVYDGDFKVKKMLQYVIDNNLTADNFDDLIEQIKNTLPNFSLDTIYGSDIDTDNLNREINDKLKDLISDLNDEDSDFHDRTKKINDIQNELKKLGFVNNSYGGYIKQMDNMNININDFDNISSSDKANESDGAYVTAKIIYKDDYYNKLGQEAPQNKIVKIPIEKLKNYVNQHTLNLEYKLMKINNIINEELNNIFNLNQEGVADKYGEKFGLANPDDEMNRIALSGIKQDDMGKFIGTYRNGELNVYLNPKSLNNFDSDVRAVTHIDGNLYIFQTNESGYHSIITFVVNNSKTNDNIGDAYTGKENLTWHRIGKTNDFGLSVSSKFYPQYPEIQQYVIENLKNSRIVNPQFNFIPMYWEDLKKIQYDAKELISKNPYGFKPIDKNTSVEDIYDIIKSNNTYAGLVKYIDSIKKQNPRNLKELTIILATIADEIDNDEYQMYEYKALSELIDRIYRSAL